MRNREATSESLYRGADLANAAARSTVRSPALSRIRGAVNALRVLGDAAREKISASGARRFEVVIARDAAATTSLTAAYAGTGANRQWCLATAFERPEVTEVRPCDSRDEVRRLVAELGRRVNITYTDGADAGGFATGDPSFLSLPAWIKQKLPIQADWTRQLSSLRRGTRQEVARMLRKYGYGCRLTTNARDAEHFYRQLYEPYVRRRFGAGVIVVEPARFLAECRRGVILQLLRGNTVVAAALLRRVAHSMAIVWSAPDPRTDPAELRGATDTMDYFSLLYAHLSRCKWLDFGPSRPDLHDGALRYKSKWGTRVTPGLIPQSPLGIRCSGSDNAEFAFLMRHAFIGRAGNGLAAHLFIDGGMQADALRALLDGVCRPGIAEYRLVALPAASNALRAVVAGYGHAVTLRDAASLRDAMPSARQA